MAELLWTLGEIVGATGGSFLGERDTPAAGLSIDSRSLHPGEAFIAIRGVKREGHAFTADALAKGASCAIVDKTYPPGDEARLVRVGDTLEALKNLGAAGRSRAKDTVVIAVTGSAGKTGTKSALQVALGASGSVHASAKSFNNHWGVPLSLANMPKTIRFGAFEIGMNHTGEIAALVPLVRPHIAIITTIAPAHLGYFRSVEEIADAKAEIFQGLESGGAAVIDADNPYYERLKSHALKYNAQIVGFGEAQDATARLLDVALLADQSDVTADILGTRISYRLGAPGRHLVQNSLAVLAAATLAGADLSAAANALGTLRADAGRGSRSLISVKGGRVLVIDESYNANPASVRAALSTLGLMPRNEFKRRVAVLGDMLELGAEGPKLHRDLAEFIDGAGVDVVFACGELMKSLYEALPESRQGAYAKTSEELQPKLLEAIEAGDAIMIKGSHGSQLAPIVEALKRLDTMSGFKGVISAAWRIVFGARSVRGDAARN